MSTTVRGTKGETMEKDGRTVGFETITSIEAMAYLETMPGNRPLSSRQVEYLVQQANAGTFFAFVAPIHFDTAGRLRNGQHRMWMVIESRLPQVFLVIRNASEEEIDALDIGKRRSGGDVLALDGYGNGAMLAGALQNLWMYEHNLVPGHSRSFFATKNSPGFTNHMMREFMTLHPGIVNSVEMLRTTPSVRLLGPPSMLAFVHYGILRANASQGEKFWASIATQNFWGQDDPAFRIFDRLSRAKNKRIDRAARLTPSEVAGLTIKAWNLWVKGHSAKLLRWKSPGHKNLGEDFPRIQGH